MGGRLRRWGGCGMLAAALLVAGPPVSATATGSTTPTVVSLNVCTDQLTMLIAAPGQLLSVSALSRDPSLSVLHDEAHAWPANRGLAEEVLQKAPDVVVTGTFTLHNTTALLRRLGFEVAEFAPAVSLDDIRANIARMGELLRREDRAGELVREFDAALEAVAAANAACPRNDDKPGVLTFGHNGVTEGAGTLQHAVIEAAGFRNLGARGGASGMNYIPLETLLSLRPDLVLTPKGFEAPSLAARQFSHPALKALLSGVTPGAVDGALWTCGSPFTAQAVETLAQQRREMNGCGDAGQ